MNDKERINATLGQLALYACTGAFTCDQDDVALFIKRFLQLEDQAELAEVWEARHNALLEQVEASRNREIAGDGSDLPIDSVVIDKDGSPWWRPTCRGWVACGGNGALNDKLPKRWGPYTVIHTPKEES